DPRGAIDEFLRQVAGVGYRTAMDRVLPGAFDIAVDNAANFFEVEVPAMGEFFATFTADRIKGLTPPIAAIVGAESAPVFHEIHKLLSSVLPRAEQVTIPRAGHMLQIENAPMVAEKLAQFFGRHPIN